jgi:transposase
LRPIIAVNERKVAPQFAQVATAHKIARTVYHLLKYKVQYVDLGAEQFEQKQRDRDVVALQKKAAKLGFTISSAVAQLAA